MPQTVLDPETEIAACSQSPLYFLDHYCQVFDATVGDWLPFRLWKAQVETLKTLNAEPRTIILKARQLGFSWLVLGYALWKMLFRPAAVVLMFSKRDNEAVEMLDMRLKEMHARLPEWLQCSEGKADGKHDWALANGSRAKAFPTTGGRSYTGSLVIVDEADYVPDLNKLLNAVKPTIDAGGQLILLSTSDKSKPESVFKRIYRAAKAKQNPYQSIFYGWQHRPGRSEEWYEEQRRDILARTGSLDDLHQEYPATDTEALSARTLDKRIPAPWIDQCYQEQSGMNPLPGGAPSIPGLEVYTLPSYGRRYVLCADPAEGNPTSDDSALEVMDFDSGEEVACLAGKFQPSVFATHIDAIGRWFNMASVLVERNNHGHAVLLALAVHSPLPRLPGLDGREGWLTTGHSKADMWSHTADCFREGAVTLHNFATRMQLGSIEGSSLEAPEGEHDDRAVAFGLCCTMFMWGRIVGEEQPPGSEEWDVIRT